MSEGSQSSTTHTVPRVLRNLTPAEPKFRHLCQKCRHLIRRSKIIQDNRLKWVGGSDDQESFQHYETLDGVVYSAFEGCHFCSILRRRCVTEDTRRREREGFSYEILITETTNGCDVRIRQGEVERLVARIMSFQRDDWLSEINLPDEPYGTLRSFGTDSLESFSRANTWLQTCINEHQDVCSVNTPSSSLLRLVRVNVVGTRVSIQLYENPFATKEEPYLALSHCWGGKVPLQLTTKTRRSFLKSIPVEDLPQTFWDAVVITARLGYQFIWIDSLCIIQDLGTDWDQQVTIMGSIYRNAVCTIAALNAEDSSRGCFTRRDPLEFDACQVDNESCLYITTDFRPAGPDTQRPIRAPLHRRAWVVQERALCPRTLYYGADMIFWECNQSVASENNPRMGYLWNAEKSAVKLIQGNPYGGPNPQKSGLKSVFHDLLDECKDGNYSRWRASWAALIHEYTSCEITRFEDRWPAVSGLATKVEETSRMKLRRGLWQDYLREELLWSADVPGNRPHQTLETEAELYAPSWSWISLKAAIWWPAISRYDRETSEVMWIADVLSATSTEIVLQAPLVRISEILLHESTCPDNWISSKLKSDAQPNMSGLKTVPDEDTGEELEIWALQILRVAERWPDLERTIFYGIFVQKKPENLSLLSRSRWSRVGYFELGWEGEHFEIPAPRWLGKTKRIKLI
ncbi:HET-domain-containing protein [Mollisia scopiformis]|uniref:HET-domain-containing protein n=1 Tax=Mollisia scopiformis TaxID=149040 RepID=A0A194WZM5_MOLSC|nr:HET-domain-containing protein [Mollisia scopiformis]KUJ13401.1 HET-domain-containing protein [Mollisia scopiformis]